MTSSKSTASTRDILNDQLLTFSCRDFSRGMRSERPKSRRWVSAEQCLCTNDTDKICDPTYLYTLVIYELSDEEVEEHARRNEEISRRNPGIPPDRIGVLSKRHTIIYVPSDFLDVLWAAAVAADGVRRSIQLTVQPQDEERWAIFGVTLDERFAEAGEVTYKGDRPQLAPPRAHPVVNIVNELRGAWARELLRFLSS
jgi:hypothetical protein